eukprot:9519002-Alexandrium_andersonii.AAC.1
MCPSSERLQKRMPPQTRPQKPMTTAADQAQSSQRPTIAEEASAAQTTVHRAAREPGGPPRRREESASCWLERQGALPSGARVRWADGQPGAQRQRACK